MHIQTKMMGHTTGEPTSMLLSFRRKRLLDIDRKNTPFVQAFSDHTHARMMNVGIRGTRLGGLKTSLLGVQNRLIQLFLEISELAVGRERARDIGRIQAIDFHTGIN